MKWEIKLSGDQFDLQKLAESKLDGDLRILEQGGQYYLESKRFESMETHEEVSREASEKLKRLTGIAKRLFNCRTPLGIASIAEVQGDGKRKFFVSVNAVAHARANVSAKIIRKDGTVEPVKPDDEASGFAKLAFSNDRVAEVLKLWGEILGLQKLNIWVNLFKIFEVIRKDVGGEKEIIKIGWALQKKISRFRSTAQLYRHFKEYKVSVSDPMDLKEAQEFIDALVGKWLDRKLTR